MMPMALVVSIHFFGESVNAFKSALLLNPSNSRGLKVGLYNVSQISKKFNDITVSHPVPMIYWQLKSILILSYQIGIF